MSVYDDLAPAPDIDNLDLTTMDRGDKVDVEPEKVEPEPEKVEPKAEELEADPENKDVVEEEAEDEEKSRERDEKGRFTEARIPKSRFDEAVGKEREAREQAERRAAELEAQLRAREQDARSAENRAAKIDEIEGSISALEKQHAELLLDGKVEDAAGVMKQIRHAERQIARLETQAESSQIVDARLEEGRVQAAVASLEAAHPELNPRSEQYDNELVQMILLLQRHLVDQNVAPSQALYEATEKVMGRVKPSAPVEKEGLGKAEQEDRRKKQVEKALDTQKRTPSSMKEVGMDTDKAGQRDLPDVRTMSAEEFAALPESTRARMRGDMI